MIKGLIFDYGATIDSNGKHWAEVIWEQYVAAKVPVTKQQFRAAYVYAERALAVNPYIKPEDNFRRLMLVKIKLEFDYLLNEAILGPDDAWNETINAIAEGCYLEAKHTVAEAIKTLKILSERYPMVLVSNFYGNIQAVLADFGVDSFFPSIIESAIVGVRKPDPAIFMLGVEALNLKPSEVTVIGDSYRKDIQPAQSLGCETIWIKGIGWDESEDKIDHPAIITDFSELCNLL